MQVALPDGSPLRGDFVLRAVQRFDLTPIPSTLELVLRADGTLGDRFVPGAMLLAGSTRDRYEVVKVRRAVSGMVQGQGGQVDVLEVTAVLQAVAALAWPLARAVIKEGRTLGEVYRSCGAAARVSSDIPIARFSCFAGQFPTVGIAQALQEEAAAPVWRSNQTLAFVRLADLFAGRPVEVMAADSTRRVDSPFLERHEVPWGLSIGPDGREVMGRRDAEQARGFVFLPRTAARVLDNVTRCLAVRRTTTGTFAGHIRAGDGIDIAGVRHIVVTAAHTWDTGASGAAADQSTRLWLAELLR